jgi:TPR repeat protein
MLCAGTIAPANADLEAGLRAYNRSDFDRARSEFFQSAMRGQAEAQCYLGEICEGDVGVAIEYAGAFTRYWLAAQRGHALAQRRR